jgi:hypothetical protein
LQGFKLRRDSEAKVLFQRSHTGCGKGSQIMDKQSPGINWTDIETDPYARLQGESALGWLGLSGGLGSPVWPGILAMLIVLGMLLAFHQVVYGAVLKGDLQRKASAMHAEAAWRCNALRGTNASASCLFQLKGAPGGDARVQATTIAAEGTVE